VTRLRFIAARAQHDAEAAAELEDHLARLTERYERSGMPPDAARRAARRQLGNPARVREDLYEMNGVGWFDALAKDLRHAARMMRRSPAFSLTAVATLALGIGANTAITGLVYSVLLKPLPYSHPEEIFSAQIVIPERKAQFDSIPASIQTVLAWRNTEQGTGMAALRPWEANLTGDGEPERIGGARVSASFLPLLGVPMAQGRFFAPDEEQPGRERVVVISDALWRRRYGADPGLIGRSLTINGDPHVVVGIAPPSLLVPTGTLLHPLVPFAPRVDVWKPIAPTPRELAVESWDHGVLVRIPRTASVEAVRQQLETSLRALIRERMPAVTISPYLELVPVREIYTARFKLRLLLVLAASTLLLLAACLSLANLLLARAASRATEFATRIALGAGRARLVGQSVVEALMLTVAGGVAGVGFAYLGVRALSAGLSRDLPLLQSAAPDLPLVVIGLSTSVLTALACGALPAWQAFRGGAASQLAVRGQTMAGGTGSERTRRVLVGVEMAVATALLASSALLLHSFLKAVNADRGYAIERVLTADLSLFGRRYADAPARAQFYRQLTDRVGALPQVQATGAISDLPMVAAGTGASRTIFHPDDRDFQRLVMMRPVAMIRGVTPGYFAASSTSLRAGRVLGALEPVEVAVVSESLTTRLWPGEPLADVIGRQFRQGNVQGPLVTVVGIVGNAQPGAVDLVAPPVIYRPYEQWSSGPMTLLVRTAGDPAALAPDVRRIVRELDPDLPILSLRTMNEVLGSTMTERRVQMVLTSAFAALALLLGAVGLYGVVSYAVACRTREIGVRLALGAPRAEVLRSVIARGMPPVIAGLTVGLAAAVGAATTLRSLLFGITPVDPLSLTVVVAVLLGTSVLACLIPARQAAALDPLVALRHE
jgi:predicted permease